MKDTVFRIAHLVLLTIIAGMLGAIAVWLYSVPRVSDLQAKDEKLRNSALMNRPILYTP